MPCRSQGASSPCCGPAVLLRRSDRQQAGSYVLLPIAPEKLLMQVVK